MTTSQDDPPTPNKDTALISVKSQSFEVGFLVGLLVIMAISLVFYFALPKFIGTFLNL